MKVWVKTKLIGSGTFENPKKPYLAGLEDKLRFSVLILNENECLARVAGKPEDIEYIKNAGIEVLTDDKALEIIKSVNPFAELEDLDVRDIEVDEIAKQLGIDPKARADVQVPEVGRRVLQDQECYLMALICERIGITKRDWDIEAKNSRRWGKGKDIDIDIRQGRIDAHEFVMSRIRSKLNNSIKPESQ